MTTPASLGPLDEWKECRTTIGRFDTIIADFRKYSFSLVTALITASSFLGQQHASVAAVVAVPIVIMILILALFAIDRYYTLLLNAAVERALDLESDGRKGSWTDLTQDRLTEVVSIYAHDSRAAYVAPLLYAGLLIGTRVLAWAMPDPATTTGAAMSRSAVDVTLACCLALGAVYFGYTEVRRHTGRMRDDRFNP